MSDTLLFERLDELVEDCSGARGDWDDVLRRAENAAVPAAPGRRLRLPRKSVLAWAVVVASLLVILFATPAFGLLKNWIGRKDVPFAGKTAPPRVQVEFADSFGSGPFGGPGTLPGEARKVAVFHAFGKSFVLYMAPNRDGGFCWTVKGMGGGCLEKRPGPKPLYLRSGEVDPQLISIEMAGQAPLRSHQLQAEIAGFVFVPEAATVSIEYENHKSVKVPFVYVSVPIDAGFVFYARPPGHRAVGTRPAAVIVRDAQGKLLARALIPYTDTPRPILTAYGRKMLPELRREQQRWRRELLGPIPAPKPPFRHGSAEGVTVLAGSNGVVVMDTSHASARARQLLERRDGYWACLDFFGPYHLNDPSGLGQGVKPGKAIQKMWLSNMPAPAACEIGSTWTTVWRDPNAAQRYLYVPLSARGKSWLANSLAARDLEQFVHLLHARGIARLTGARLDQALARNFGKAVVLIPSSSSPLALKEIGYVHIPGGATFYERSSLGRRFSVRITNGRLELENGRA